MLRSDYAIDGPLGAHLDITKQPDGTYKATPNSPNLSSFAKIGRSEMEAINLTKQALQEAASQGKI